MRTLLFCSLLFMAFSCKKNNQPVQHDFSLPGTWRLFSRVGGIAGINETFPTSQGNLTYIFRADSTCTVIDITGTANNTFSIAPDSAYICHCIRAFINIAGNRMLISNAHDTLWLSHDVNDALGYGFIKDY